MIKIWKRG